ncbi:hypothetical protein F1880_004610, partial [Penicillium rolfsii]
TAAHLLKPLITRPWIPKIELSGEVIAAGDNAPPELREPGTNIIGFQRVLAEYICVLVAHLTRVDPGVDMTATPGINGARGCALKICRTVRVMEGRFVPLNGARRSVESMLVHLSEVCGARVVGVASGGNEKMVCEFGVDEICF